MALRPLEPESIPAKFSNYGPETQGLARIKTDQGFERVLFICGLQQRAKNSAILQYQVTPELTRRMTLPSDVSTSAQEDHAATFSDPQLLEPAVALKRILFGFDRGFLDAKTIFSPHSASRRAISRPMPEEAPVTRAHGPYRFCNRSFRLLLFCICVYLLRLIGPVSASQPVNDVRSGHQAIRQSILL